jgi:uncharacterized iron-regulated protein
MVRKFILTSFFTCLTFVSCSGKELDGQTVLRIIDGKKVKFEEMIDDVITSDIIIVGELHDVSEHHQFQLKLIKSIYEKEKNIAIAMEMFRADSQDSLDKWISGKMSLDDFIKVYYDNWKIGWSLYADILNFARDNKIPIIGLNVPPEITKKVAQKGFASLSKEDLKKLPKGVSCHISETYMNFIRKTHSFHSSGKEFVYFCEAQMLWDRAMAINTVNYKKEKNINKVILLTGRGHAWKHAIPEQIKQVANYKVSVILPYLVDKDQPILTVDDADYLF